MMSTQKHKGIDNLTPWPKGVSGNMNGRPPNSYSKQLREIDPDSGMSYADLIANYVIQFALEADVIAIAKVLKEDKQNVVEKSVRRIAKERGVRRKDIRVALQLFGVE